MVKCWAPTPVVAAAEPVIAGRCREGGGRQKHTRVVGFQAIQ